MRAVSATTAAARAELRERLAWHNCPRGCLASHLLLLGLLDDADALAAAEERVAGLEERLRPGSPTERAPTTWAYEAACVALHKHRERAEAAEARVAELERRLALAPLPEMCPECGCSTDFGDLCDDCQENYTEDVAAAAPGTAGAGGEG